MVKWFFNKKEFIDIAMKKPTNDILRKKLNSLEYKVTQKGATEPPFSHNGFDKETEKFVCICCDSVLFKIEDKFDSGSGWPSFTIPFSSTAISEFSDESFGMIRTEVKCSKCSAHLGHVFEDGPQPTGLRYCINGVAIKGVK